MKLNTQHSTGQKWSAHTTHKDLIMLLKFLLKLASWKSTASSVTWEQQSCREHPSRTVFLSSWGSMMQLDGSLGRLLLTVTSSHDQLQARPLWFLSRFSYFYYLGGGKTFLMSNQLGIYSFFFSRDSLMYAHSFMYNTASHHVGHLLLLYTSRNVWNTS